MRENLSLSSRRANRLLRIKRAIFVVLHDYIITCDHSCLCLPSCHREPRQTTGSLPRVFYATYPVPLL